MAAGATLAYLLYITTGSRLLLGALGSLGVPNIFVVLLLMTHRYLFVLVRAVEEIGLAMTSRTIALSDGASGRKLTAFVIGSVFMRSKRLADDVHQAMLSRGFTGEIRFLKSPKPTFQDFSWVATCVVIAAVLIFLDG
jgi:cobalt/nickel transport system permease protein